MRTIRPVLLILVAAAAVIAIVVMTRPDAIPGPKPTPIALATETRTETSERNTTPPEPSQTPMHEAGYTRPTSTPGPTISPASFTDTPTFDPNLLLTPQMPPTETATPPPLTDLGEGIELNVIQLSRILRPDGVIFLADILNPTDRPVKDVTLVFTRISGERVGQPQALDLDLVANEASPGATELLAPDDPIIAGWDELQVHAVGTPNNAGTSQSGNPAMLEVGYPEVSVDKTTLYFRVTVKNVEGATVSVPHQSLAFFANDGTLLLVWKLGSHETIPAGGSYDLTGQIRLDQPVTEGRALQEYSDVLAVLSAELAQ
jgi:hypothetical protein